MAKFLSNALLFVGLGVLVGCDNSEVSRQPSTAEIQKSNENRAAGIDKLNIPEAQKEQMKAHLGGTKGDRSNAPAAGN